jgi:hypothetical protein
MKCYSMRAPCKRVFDSIVIMRAKEERKSPSCLCLRVFFCLCQRSCCLEDVFFVEGEADLGFADVGDDGVS